MKLTFLGATGTVTGSKYLLETSSKKVLIDCGLFQGLKDLRQKNREPLPVNPSSLDTVVLTHAHIDHSGYLPLLVKNGFRGKILCTPATRALCSVLLPDSGYLQEEEARFANKHRTSKHKPALPLYTKDDALKALDYFHEIEVGKDYDLGDELTLHLNRAGHIIGAAFVTFLYNKTSIVFSGDIGRSHPPLMKAPSIIQQADYLVLESTYGDRKHSDLNLNDQLMDIINRTVKRGGSLVIPAFAVGRSQQLLYAIYQLKKNNLIPDLPVYLDSPMAIKATKLFCKHSASHQLSKQVAIEEVCNAATSVESRDDSKAIDNEDEPKIIISASGMATGGRVLHHLKYFLPNERNSVILAGFQAAQTRGDRLARGEKRVRIFGQDVPVNAEVYELENASAHADYSEILEWLNHFDSAPRKIFITHGEPKSSLSLKEKVEKRFKWNCVIPKLGDSFEL